MHSKRKKQLEEMTVEERLEKIHKMSTKDLNYLLHLDSNNVLSAKELEAIYNEKDRRSNRQDKVLKVSNVAAVTGAALLGILHLIGNSSDKS